MEHPRPRFIALVEEGAWRVKDTKENTYLFSKEPYDEWTQVRKWVSRSEVTDHSWGVNCAWNGAGEDHGRAARMLATFANDLDGGAG